MLIFCLFISLMAKWAVYFKAWEVYINLPNQIVTKHLEALQSKFELNSLSLNP